MTYKIWLDGDDLPEILSKSTSATKLNYESAHKGRLYVIILG